MNEQFDKALADLYSRFLAAKVHISNADLWLKAEDYFSRVDLEVRRSVDAEDAKKWLNRANDVIVNIRYLDRHWRPVDGPLTQKYTGYACSKCQVPTVPSYSPPIGQRMIDRQLCFYCDYWEQKAIELRTDQNPRRLIINHHIYLDAGRSRDNPTHLGFGGREFKYRRIGSNDIVSTNNLWSGARLPPEYWPEFPDTAEFVN